MTRILVTGGAGYVGSHTCKNLSKQGLEPITFDNLSTGHESSVKWGPLIRGDLSQTELLIKTLEKYRPNTVIHFAGSAYVGESVANPFKYYWNNVQGTLSLLSAMSTAGIKNIIFSSTCATYGSPDVSLIKEECPQIPINPYGYSKLFIERILGDMSSRGQINHVCLRYFNAAGADKDVEIGELHDPETHLIPLAIRSGFKGGDVLKIFGVDFATPDGTAVRDYVHVEDLAEAHIQAVKYLNTGAPSDYFNLGTGNGSSVREIVEGLRRIGVDVRFTDAARRSGDPAFLVADPQKANKVLGWRPIYKNIDDILRTAVKWHLKNG